MLSAISTSSETCEPVQASWGAAGAIGGTVVVVVVVVGGGGAGAGSPVTKDWEWWEPSR